MLEFWDSKPFIDAANILVGADEPLRALELLDNLPGYYRDFPPQDIKDLKRNILKSLATNTLYLGTVPFPTDKDLDRASLMLRWEKIRDDVLNYNEQNIFPHIVDMGPGEYWLPLLLRRNGFMFTYSDITTCLEMKEEARKRLGTVYKEEAPYDRPIIFVACEIIEHLHNEKDIASECYKLSTQPKIIHISTPRYAYDPRLVRLYWRNHGPLGHLRTYTPKEFEDVVVEMFPAYNFISTHSNILHIKGVLS